MIGKMDDAIYPYTQTDMLTFSKHDLCLNKFAMLHVFLLLLLYIAGYVAIWPTYRYTVGVVHSGFNKI